MRRSRLCAMALAGLAAASAGRACFIGAPWQLFDNRSEVRNATPVNSFAWEASHLVPTPKLPLPLPPRIADSYDRQRAEAEAIGLDPRQQAAVQAMRFQQSTASALAAGKGLPESVRLYTAGAVAFAHDDLASAAVSFQAVLDRPFPESAARAVWAAYMLGRLAAEQGDPAGAATFLAQTRALAGQGAPDPLRLATASLGDEARLRLDAGEVPQAVALYAEQAAAGSDEGEQSLRMVAEDLMAHPERLADAVRDPLTQRLLVIYALALAGDYLHAVHTGGTSDDYEGFFPRGDLDTTPLRTLFDAVWRSGVTVAETDRLAALAYQLGDYEAAKSLAAASGTALALWLQAKLELQAGHDGAGGRLLAQALHISAQSDDAGSLEPSSAGLLRGEAATWTLGRGDFVQAMTVLWPTAQTYWGDAAYLAERVLTTDELKAFVNANAAEPELQSTELGTIVPVNQVRSLLARRLMRDGRYDEASAYFDRLAKQAPDTKADAVAFARGLRRSHEAFWASNRAQAGWDAALLLRRQGMELMGTETLPDSKGFMDGDLDGELSGGYGPPPGGPVSQRWGTFVQDEVVRYQASRAEPDLRFHYRYLAADQAVQAAAELPPRSQAYAAILCQASHWMLSSHADEKAAAIYRRYVSAGAVVPFATHFGHGCPEPDFAAVSATRQKLASLQVRDVIHRHKQAMAAGTALLLAAVAASTVWARRR